MFEFLKRTKKEVITVPDVKVSEVVVTFMNTYIEECKNDEELTENNLPGLEKEYSRLENLGLKNTENAKIISTRLEEIKRREEEYERGKRTLEYMKELKTVFPSSYLISFNQFYWILKKYNLVTNFSSEYRGAIPTKNISDIEKVVTDLKYLNKDRLHINLYKRGGNYYCFLYAMSLGYMGREYKEDAEKIMNSINKIGSIVSQNRPFQPGYSYSSIPLTCINEVNQVIEDINKPSESNIYTDKFSIEASPINQQDLLIAAPKDCFSESFKISLIETTDPIVFQYCPYGVIIHSVWGEEANDKVLKEYSELNRIISE
jgi:hypothetical protein